MWVDRENLEKVMRFEDDTTVLIGRFRVSSWEGERVADWTPRTISYHANYAARQSFKNYEKALKWCRGHRFAVKVEREF